MNFQLIGYRVRKENMKISDLYLILTDQSILRYLTFKILFQQISGRKFQYSSKHRLIHTRNNFTIFKVAATSTHFSFKFLHNFLCKNSKKKHKAATTPKTMKIILYFFY